MDDVIADTSAFESWLGKHCDLHQPDLRYKHARMSDPWDPFPFFRGTYYRWVKLWRAACPELLEAPRVLAVGDIHIENFGTWRDAEHRLCWGINDFDEADELPYTNDLVRLAASVRFARKAGLLKVKLSVACRAILTGYRAALETGGKPFILEEHHPQLRAMAMTAEREPPWFWEKLTKLLADPAVDPPAEARDVLLASLPDAGLRPAFRFRPKTGFGSLGKPRIVALAEWSGSWLCREAKAITPPATAREAGMFASASRMAEAVKTAIRCPDPFYRPGAVWMTRRLAPLCSRIELNRPDVDVEVVLRAMGAEAANVHLGTPKAAYEIQRDLAGRAADWLEVAARSAFDAIERDWKDWRCARVPK